MTDLEYVESPPCDLCADTGLVPDDKDPFIAHLCTCKAGRRMHAEGMADLWGAQ